MESLKDLDAVYGFEITKRMISKALDRSSRERELVRS